jgi:hypothetical protein
LTVSGTVKVNSLTANQAVVTDASSNLVSLEYTSLNTPSTLVARDSLGNFSAGLINANNLNLNSLSSLAGAANQGVLVVDSSSVKRQSYADLSTHLNVPSIHPIDISPNINAQGMWLEWDRVGSHGESWIINQKGGGSDGIRFGRSDTSDNVTEWARFDGSGNFLLKPLADPTHFDTYIQGPIANTVGSIYNTWTPPGHSFNFFGGPMVVDFHVGNKYGTTSVSTDQGAITFLTYRADGTYDKQLTLVYNLLETGGPTTTVATNVYHLSSPGGGY